MTFPAVIIDRDGTLARIDRSLVEGDNPNWYEFHAAIPFDSPVPAIVRLTRMLSENVAVIIMTGRSEDQRKPMQDWLTKHGVHCHWLLMRPAKDQRADHLVKAELYEGHVAPYYDVQFVVDDRPSVCDMWRSKGLHVIQVTQPEEIPVFEGLGL